MDANGAATVQLVFLSPRAPIALKRVASLFEKTGPFMIHFQGKLRRDFVGGAFDRHCQPPIVVFVLGEVLVPIVWFLA